MRMSWKRASLIDSRTRKPLVRHPWAVVRSPRQDHSEDGIFYADRMASQEPMRPSSVGTAVLVSAPIIKKFGSIHDTPGMASPFPLRRDRKSVV